MEKVVQQISGQVQNIDAGELVKFNLKDLEVTIAEREKLKEQAERIKILEV